MNRIVRHTEYLLRKHDCVIVPGFGAFIANHLPAYIEQQRIYPPRREVSFNGEITLGDGLLARSIARGEGVGYDAACRMIAEGVDCLAHQIEADGSVSFGRLGRFSRQEGSTPLFEPSRNTSLINPFHALPPFDIVSAAEQEIAEAEERKADRTHFYVPISRNIFKIAASVAMLVGVVMMLLSPLPLDQQPSMASVARTNVVPQERPIEIVPTKTANPQLYIAIPHASKGIAMADTTARTEAKEKSERFILVVASLASDAQARRYIEEAGDPTLRVIVQDGKHRVYAASGETYDGVAAMRLRPEVASAYPDAWVCRK